jgi:hypothetical protein
MYSEGKTMTTAYYLLFNSWNLLHVILLYLFFNLTAEFPEKLKLAFCPSIGKFP